MRLRVNVEDKYETSLRFRLRVRVRVRVRGYLAAEEIEKSWYTVKSKEKAEA